MWYFIKICLICIIGWKKISQKNPEYNYSLPCSCSYNLSSFWLILKQQWTIKMSSPCFLFLAWRPSWLKVGITGHTFGRGPCKDHSTKVWLQLVQWFLKRRFVCEFPIGSYVKLSSAVAAISIGSLKCRIQFWKGATHGSSEQSLVEIGSVVSEEKIFF